MKRRLRTFLITILACLMISGSALSTSAACPERVISLGGCNLSCDDPALTSCKGNSDILSCLRDCLSRCGCVGNTCRTLILNLNACAPTGTSVCPAPANNNCAAPAENNCEDSCVVPPTVEQPSAPAPTEAPAPPTEIPAKPAQPAVPATEAVDPTESVAEPTNAPEEPTEAAPIPTETESYALSDYELEVVRLINDIRAQYGLGTLSVDTDLSRVARLKSQDMHDRGYFSHTSPTYGSPFDMMDRFGIRYRTAGENIAMGYRSPQSVVDGWMNSDGHRRNILNGSFTRIGMGYVADGNYWTQMFIG